MREAELGGLEAWFGAGILGRLLDDAEGEVDPAHVVGCVGLGEDHRAAARSELDLAGGGSMIVTVKVWPAHAVKAPPVAAGLSEKTPGSAEATGQLPVAVAEEVPQAGTRVMASMVSLPALSGDVEEFTICRLAGTLF